MDLFPAGSFVRLRSRARGKYVHADEDGTSVSLRPLGAAPSPNAVWKVGLQPVEGGGNHLLLQGAASGRYLAVVIEDEAPPSGHRGVRAVQRDYNPVDLDPSIMWTPYRVEAGQNYVRLHNREQLCLRANGRYRVWNNLVTADVRNGDETTMMQWTVEATPEPLPHPSPPQPPRRTRHDVHPRPGRTIQHVRLDDDGYFVKDHWHNFVSYDNSVSNQRTQVARLEGDEIITFGTNLPKK